MCRGTFALLAACLAALHLLCAPAAALEGADKRIAFVIGNGAYKGAPALENPNVDAKAVAAALKRLGFEVIEGYDLDLAAMKLKVAEFAAVLPEAKAALLYHAGHGVSVDEENYLLPTDVVLRTPSDLDLNAVALLVLLKMMKRQESVNVVILDACRDNPFAAEFASNSRKTRAAVASRGLSAIDNDLAKGTLIAFATDPKSTALDGRAGENSPFTKALLTHIEDPGVPIGTVMDRVRADVYAATHNKQTPWVNTSLIGEFFLNPLAPAPGAAVSALTPAPGLATLSNADRQLQENKLWDSAEKSNTPEDYKVYVEAYPNGVYAQMAKNRIARLSGPAPAAPAAAAPAQAPAAPPADALAPAVLPAAPIVTAAELKRELGTIQTEKSLGLDRAARREVQMRLLALDFDPRESNGNFGEKTRAAIAEWQKRHEIAATSWLGPVQMAALKQESEVQ